MSAVGSGQLRGPAMAHSLVSVPGEWIPRFLAHLLLFGLATGRTPVAGDMAQGFQEIKKCAFTCSLVYGSRRQASFAVKLTSETIIDCDVFRGDTDIGSG